MWEERCPVPPRWSPEPWEYFDGLLHSGLPPEGQIIAEVYGRVPEEANANGCLMAVAPEAARLLAFLYPHAPIALRERIYTWFAQAGVTLEDFEDRGTPRA